MSTTTKIVYRLKDEGLVDTYSCEDDARITRVLLTEKGQPKRLMTSPMWFWNNLLMA